MQDVADLAPVTQNTTYTEIFEQTFKNNKNNEAGFVVNNAPWEKKGKGGKGGANNANAPNTASHEDFPGFGGAGSNDGGNVAATAASVGASAWNSYR